MPTVTTSPIELFSPSDTTVGANIIADGGNSAAILVAIDPGAFGATGSAAYAPLNANGVVFVPPGFKGKVYGQAVSGTQKYYVLQGSQSRLLSIVNPGSGSTVNLGAVSILAGSNQIGLVTVSGTTRTTLTNTSLGGTTSATAGTLTALFGSSTLAKHFTVYYPKAGTGVLSLYGGNGATYRVIELSPQQGFSFNCSDVEQTDLSKWYVSSTIADDTYEGVYLA